MPYLIKMDPIGANSGDVVQISERRMYNGDSVKIGDEIFLYFSEDSGGNGLTWSGVVDACPSNGGRRLAVRLLRQCERSQVGIEQLKPFRDVRDGSPISELARKFYRHAHNKIARISEDEAAYVRRYFL